MEEWGGWAYEEKFQSMEKPFRLRISGTEGRVFLELLRAKGEAVPFRRMWENLGLQEGSVRVMASKVRGALGPFSLMTARGVGFALRSVADMEEAARLDKEMADAYADARARRLKDKATRRSVGDAGYASQRKRERLVELFIDQFEATAPHARAVAKTVMAMFGEQ